MKQTKTLRNLSMERMMQNVLASAVRGRKTNPADARQFTQGIRRHFYRWFIEALYVAWRQGTKTTYQVLDEVRRTLAGQSNADAQALVRTLDKLAY